MADVPATAALHALPGRRLVVVLADGLDRGVHANGNDFGRQPGVKLPRNRPCADLVGAPRGRALAGVVALGELAGLWIAVVRAVPVDAGERRHVGPDADGVLTRAADAAGEQRTSAVVVVDVPAVAPTQVGVERVCSGVRERHRPLAVALLLQWRVRLWAMPELQVLLVPVVVAGVEAADSAESAADVPEHFEQRVPP